MRGNIIASIAVFQNLYNNGNDIYSVLARFVTATINQKNLWSFDITTLRNNLRECFGIDVYESVLKTVIRGRLGGSISNSNGEYLVKPNTVELEQFTTQLSEQSKRYKFVYDALIEYYRSSTNLQVSDQDIINSFTKFILTDNGQDVKQLFSRFILSKSGDEYFISCLNEIKEGYVIISGLKDISESTDLNSTGSWTHKLTIYLDTEELFSAYGYNGELHCQILNDFLKLVKEANRRNKNIELKYLDETKKVVDGYFGQATRIIRGYDKPDGKPAMSAILSNCQYASDVLVEQGKFYAFLKTHDIVYDERSNYIIDMNGNLQTQENLDAIKSDAAESTLIVGDDEVMKYLRMFSIINNKRQQDNYSSFERCQYVLLTENSIPKYISKHPAIRNNNSFSLSTTVDYAISKLWFRLHKGLIGHNQLVSFDIVNRVKIIITSLLHQSVLSKYQELDTENYSKDERISIYNRIRTFEIYPEEITKDNIENIIDFIELKDVESLRREQALMTEKIHQGEIAHKELAKFKQRSRNRYKRKVRSRIKTLTFAYHVMMGIIFIMTVWGIAKIIIMIVTPQDTYLSILSFFISCIISTVISIIPFVKRSIIYLRNKLTSHYKRKLLIKFAQQEYAD